MIKEVDVLFAVQDSVVEVKLNGLPVYGNGMRVKVLKEQAANGLSRILHLLQVAGFREELREAADEASLRASFARRWSGLPA